MCFSSLPFHFSFKALMLLLQCMCVAVLTAGFSQQPLHTLSYARFAPQTVISAHCKLQPHYACCTQSASKTKGDTEHAGRTRKIWFAVTWELNKQWWKMGTTTQQYSKWAGGAAAKMKNLHHHEAPIGRLKSKFTSTELQHKWAEKCTLL